MSGEHTLYSLQLDPPRAGGKLALGVVGTTVAVKRRGGPRGLHQRSDMFTFKTVSCLHIQSSGDNPFSDLGPLLASRGVTNKLSEHATTTRMFGALICNWINM